MSESNFNDGPLGFFSPRSHWLTSDVVTFSAEANVAEAAILREVGHDADILLLSPTLPGELPRALALGLDLTLNSLDEARALGSRVVVDANGVHPAQ